MATKAKKTAKKEYTVRIEWPVTYYCDTTVEASSPEEAARIAMEDPDYENQDSYDEPGDSEVEGVCEGDEYSFDERIEVDAAPAEFAGVVWTVEDIKDRMPEWSDERCKKFLDDNEDSIQQEMIEAAGCLIKARLPRE
jgi:hypothetical protein